MANKREIKTTLSIDGEAKFKKVIAESNQKLSLLNSEMKNTTASFALNEKSVKSLTAKNEVLYKSVDAQQEKVNSLSGIVKELSEKYGEADKRTVEWQKKLNYAEAQLKTTQRTIRSNSEEIENLNRTIRGEAVADLAGKFKLADNALSGLNKNLKREKIDQWKAGFSEADQVLRGKFAQGVKIASAALATITASGAAAAKTFLDLAESTREYRLDLAKLQANANSTGYSIDFIKSQLKELGTVSDETDSNMEALNNLMRTGLSADKLAVALENLTGASIAWSDTLKIESLADSFQESLLNNGNATGQFAELLERCGVDIDQFNDGLVKAKKRGDEQNYMLKALSDTGLASVARGYKKANQSLTDAAEAQFEYNDALAELGKKAEPVMAAVQNGFTNILKTVTKNTDTKKVEEFTKKAMKQLNQLAADGIPKLEKGLELINKHGNTIIASGKGIATTAVSYKVLSTAINGASTVIKNFANPTTRVTMAVSALALVTTGLIGATVALTEKIKAEKAALAQANLEAHFGKISLSMEEVNEMARKLIDDGNFSKLEEAVSGFAKTDEYLKNMQSAMDEINKLNWKVSVGMELTEDDKEAYKQNIQSFIADANNTLSQQQYSINLALNVLGFDNNSDVTSGLNGFYSKKQKELADLGKKLQGAVNNAFGDGLLTIDEANVIADLQSQIATVTEKMTDAELESKLDMIRLKFSGAELTPESQAEMQRQINEEIENASKNYEKSFVEASAALRVQLEEGDINQKEFDTKLEELQSGLQQKLDDLRLKSTDFGLSTIAETFGEEVTPAVSNMLDSLRNTISEQIEADKGSDQIQFNLTELMNIPNELDEKTKTNLAGLYEQMKPDLDRLKQSAQSYIDAGKAVPENIAKGIMDIEALGAISGSKESLYTIIGGLAKESDPRFQGMMKEYESLGVKIPENITKGIEVNGSGISDKIGDVFSKGVKSAEEKARDYETAGMAAIDFSVKGMVKDADKIKIESEKDAIAGAKAFGAKGVPAFEESGKNMIKGAANGITKNAGILCTAARNAALSAIEAFRKANDEHSPSKKYEKMTSFCVDGAVLGFEKNAYKAERAVASFARRSMDAFNMSVSMPEVGFNGGSFSAGSFSETRQTVNIDYDRLAACMVNALTGVTVECDKRQFGRLISEVTA